MKYFFTADEHYYHENIIRYCNRPFANVSEMHERLIANHNSLVRAEDFVLHIGDFSLGNKEVTQLIIDRLNGLHGFVRGSHDNWLKGTGANDIWTHKIDNIDNNFIVACHYAMRLWPRSHYNSWQLHGHSHGRLHSIGKQMDVGVDTNYFYPYAYESIVSSMQHKDDNKGYTMLQARKQ